MFNVHCPMDKKYLPIVSAKRKTHVGFCDNPKIALMGESRNVIVVRL